MIEENLLAAMALKSAFITGLAFVSTNWYCNFSSKNISSGFCTIWVNSVALAFRAFLLVDLSKKKERHPDSSCVR